jgi:hypothetical protein
MNPALHELRARSLPSRVDALQDRHTVSRKRERPCAISGRAAFDAKEARKRDAADVPGPLL